MRMDQLILSGLDITEDEYSFKAQFILNGPDKAKSVDLETLEQIPILKELKSYFELEESIDEIKDKLMDMVMEKANIYSKIIEGEDFEETINKKNLERMAKDFDLS